MGKNPKKPWYLLRMSRKPSLRRKRGGKKGGKYYGKKGRTRGEKIEKKNEGRKERMEKEKKGKWRGEKREKKNEGRKKEKRGRKNEGKREKRRGGKRGRRRERDKKVAIENNFGANKGYLNAYETFIKKDKSPKSKGPSSPPKDRNKESEKARNEKSFVLLASTLHPKKIVREEMNKEKRKAEEKRKKEEEEKKKTEEDKRGTKRKEREWEEDKLRD